MKTSNLPKKESETEYLKKTSKILRLPKMAYFSYNDVCFILEISN